MQRPAPTPPNDVIAATAMPQVAPPQPRRRVVVLHGLNREVFAGLAQLRHLVEEVVEYDAGTHTRPPTARELANFIRTSNGHAYYASHALPVLDEPPDLTIRSLVPIAHPLARVMRLLERQGPSAVHDEFVATALAKLPSGPLANLQVAVLAGGRFRAILGPDEASAVAQPLCAGAVPLLVDFDQLAACQLTAALVDAGAPLIRPARFAPTATTDLLERIEELRRTLPGPLMDELVRRNTADLVLFDAVVAAAAARAPLGEGDRAQIREIADAAAELTGHRTATGARARATTETDADFDELSFFRAEPVLGWWPKPNATVERTVLGRRVTMEVDEHGYRPVPARPEAGEKTLAAYGCSNTFGWALPVEETYCARLQRMLPSWRVENHDMNGFGTVHNVIQLERDAVWSQPDYVTFGWIPNHMLRSVAHHSLVQSYQFDRWWSSPITTHPKAEVDAEGRLSIKQIRFKRPDLVGLDLDDFGPDEHGIENVTAELFRRASEIVRTAGGEFFVTILRGAMTPSLRRRVDADGIPVVDASLNAREYSLLPDDGHPNGLANEIFAQRIYEHVTGVPVEAVAAVSARRDDAA